MPKVGGKHYAYTAKGMAKAKAEAKKNRQESLLQEEEKEMSLYKNIHAKRKRIKAGSKEKMRKPGTKGAPTAAAFKAAAKTAKKPKKRTKK